MTAVDKRPARVAGMFDAIAARYDFLNHFFSAGIDRRWRKRAIRSLKLTGRERVVDVCTGTADLAIAARTATPPAAQVLGVDFAGEMLRIGHAKLAAAALDRSIVLVRGDAMRLPAPTAAADGVTVAFGIRNVQDPQVGCDEMFRVLRPGGRVAVLEFAIPTMPGIRSLYLWYFRRVMPAIGRIISRHNAAYGYLPASVTAFASPDEFVTILRKSGFVDVAAVPLTLGIVYLYTGTRP